MFSRTILHVEMLALEVCCKTKELTKSMQGGRWKEGATNVDTSQQLKCQEREIIGCATRLVQVRSLWYIDCLGGRLRFNPNGPGEKKSQLKQTLSRLMNPFPPLPFRPLRATPHVWPLQKQIIGRKYIFIFDIKSSVWCTNEPVVHYWRCYFHFISALSYFTKL